MNTMTIELTCLVVVTAFTGLLWVPYILNRLTVGKGLLHEVGYLEEPTKLSPWADRLKRAHANAIENLVVFAPLLLATSVVGVQSQTTTIAAEVYVAARVLHALAYALGIPWVRTLAFSAGWGSQMALAWALLTH
jgi:uncharacterized MAPEG superfamily protein